MKFARLGARGVALVGAIALLIGVFGTGSATSDAGPLNAKHFFYAQGQSPSASTTDTLQNDLIYHGGKAGPGAIGVEQKPAVYLIWWGTEWANGGFTTEDTNGAMYSSKTLQTYLQSFFQNVGGSPWAGVQTQYCAYALPGSTNCVGGGGFITNPTKQLKGVWTDPTPVPDDIVTYGLAQNLVDDPIASEAVRAVQHFGWNPDATYIILTPPAHIGTGEGAVYCAYHTQTTSVDGLGNPERIQYAFIPWLNENFPGSGPTGCGMHSVNATSNAFGNGIFDGWSIVTGHEYSEAVTDPDNFSSIQDGWNDATTFENADKCAWIDMQNITLGGHKFAVQPTWSNKDYDATGNGCVVK